MTRTTVSGGANGSRFALQVGAADTATVTVWEAGNNGWLAVDKLELVPAMPAPLSDPAGQQLMLGRGASQA